MPENDPFAPSLSEIADNAFSESQAQGRLGSFGIGSTPSLDSFISQNQAPYSGESFPSIVPQERYPSIPSYEPDRILQNPQITPLEGRHTPYAFNELFTPQEQSNWREMNMATWGYDPSFGQRERVQESLALPDAQFIQKLQEGVNDREFLDRMKDYGYSDSEAQGELFNYKANKEQLQSSMASAGMTALLAAPLMSIPFVGPLIQSAGIGLGTEAAGKAVGLPDDISRAMGFIAGGSPFVKSFGQALSTGILGFLGSEFGHDIGKGVGGDLGGDIGGVVGGLGGGIAGFMERPTRLAERLLKPENLDVLIDKSRNAIRSGYNSLQSIADEIATPVSPGAGRFGAGRATQRGGIRIPPSAKSESIPGAVTLVEDMERQLGYKLPGLKEIARTKDMPNEAMTATLSKLSEDYDQGLLLSVAKKVSGKDVKDFSELTVPQAVKTFMQMYSDNAAASKSMKRILAKAFDPAAESFDDLMRTRKWEEIPIVKEMFKNKEALDKASVKQMNKLREKIADVKSKEPGPLKDAVEDTVPLYEQPYTPKGGRERKDLEVFGLGGKPPTTAEIPEFGFDESITPFANRIFKGSNIWKALQTMGDSGVEIARRAYALSSELIYLKRLANTRFGRMIEGIGNVIGRKAKPRKALNGENYKGSNEVVASERFADWYEGNLPNESLTQSEAANFPRLKQEWNDLHLGVFDYMRTAGLPVQEAAGVTRNAREVGNWWPRIPTQESLKGPNGEARLLKAVADDFAEFLPEEEAAKAASDFVNASRFARSAMESPLHARTGYLTEYRKDLGAGFRAIHGELEKAAFTKYFGKDLEFVKPLINAIAEDPRHGKEAAKYAMDAIDVLVGKEARPGAFGAVLMKIFGISTGLKVSKPLSSLQNISELAKAPMMVTSDLPKYLEVPKAIAKAAREVVLPSTLEASEREAVEFTSAIGNALQKDIEMGLSLPDAPSQTQLRLSGVSNILDRVTRGIDKLSKASTFSTTSDVVSVTASELAAKDLARHGENLFRYGAESPRGKAALAEFAKRGINADDVIKNAGVIPEAQMRIARNIISNEFSGLGTMTLWDFPLTVAKWNPAFRSMFLSLRKWSIRMGRVINDYTSGPFVKEYKELIRSGASKGDAIKRVLSHPKNWIPTARVVGLGTIGGEIMNDARVLFRNAFGSDASLWPDDDDETPFSRPSSLFKRFVEDLSTPLSFGAWADTFRLMLFGNERREQNMLQRGIPAPVQDMYRALNISIAPVGLGPLVDRYEQKTEIPKLNFGRGFRLRAPKPERESKTAQNVWDEFTKIVPIIRELFPGTVYKEQKPKSIPRLNLR